MSGAATLAATGPAASARRVAAMVLRYGYLLFGSWPRMVELAYWPTVQMIIWGFVTTFFVGHSSWVAQATGVLLGAVLLWDVMFRGQLGFSISFFEEMWSRNLGHLFVSPLRPWEFVVALMTMSLIRTLIGLLPAALLAIPLYRYSIFELGLPLVAFFSALLICGWSIGLVVSGLVLRWGLGAESLAWAAIFAFAPISGVYYPIDTLPEWLQYVAWATPSAYVFEGMRSVMFEGALRTDLLVGAFAVDAVYLAVGALAFLAAYRSARREGRLLQVGE